MQCNIDGSVYMFAIVGASTLVCSIVAITTRALDTILQNRIEELKRCIDDLKPSQFSDTEYTD